MLPSLGIDSDFQSFLVVESDPAIEVSLHPVTVLIDEHGISFFILHQLVALFIEATNVSLCIFLYSVVLRIVAYDLSAGQDGDFEVIFIVVV